MRGKEYILCAAIHFDDGNYYPHHRERGLVACGYRHHLIFAFRPKNTKKETQGFLTSKNNFVTRAEALKIAIEAGQVDASLSSNSSLFSEDLY
jgi:hypothetical protein